jgi:hypothetical protein
MCSAEEEKWDEPRTKTCCYGGKLIASWFPNRQPNLFSISEQERRELLMAPGISMAALAALMIILEHSLTEHQRVFLSVLTADAEVYSHQHQKNTDFSLCLPIYSMISSKHLGAKIGPKFLNLMPLKLKIVTYYTPHLSWVFFFVK